ncbi:MAG: hypothetical protein ACTSRS_19430 [Candidatus Helarchaeota archaeon]
MPNEIPGSVTIYVNLEEISAVGESFSFQIGTIVEVILMGPVFALIYFVLMKNLLSKINRETGRNRRLIYILEVAVVGFICMLVMGHIVHLMFDYANAIYRATYGGYDNTPLFLYLYHSDEWLGHHLIHIGFFSFLILAMIGESRIADKRRMRWYEVIIAIGLGAGIFVINGYATYEGQCGWLLMVLSSVLLGIQVGIILLKKVNPLWYPIFFSALLGNIIVIGYYLWYTSVFGTLPYYPFAPQ